MAGRVPRLALARTQAEGSLDRVAVPTCATVYTDHARPRSRAAPAGSSVWKHRLEVGGVFLGGSPIVQANGQQAHPKGAAGRGE